VLFRSSIKINTDLKDSGVLKGMDKKTQAGVIASEIKEAMSGMFGEGSNAQIDKLIAEMQKTASGGDLSKAIDSMAEKMAKRAELDQKAPGASANAERRDNLANTNTQLTNVIAQLHTYLSQQDKASGRTQDNTNAAGANERLIAAINPLAGVMASLPQSMKTNTDMVSTNNSIMQALIEEMRGLKTTFKDETKKPKATTTEKTPPPVTNVTNNITINQRDFRVDDKSKADQLAKKTADDIKSGMGNGS
jgi:hypothetical protein